MTAGYGEAGSSVKVV